MKYCFILIFVVLFYNSFAQGIIDNGSYYITNYTPEDYEASTQIFSITQDNRGIMYFGNMNGVLEFDGNNWQLYEISNKSLPRALAVDKNGRLFIGATNEFGFLANDSLGNGKYISLINLIPENDRSFNDIIKVLPSNEGINFLTSNKVYQYNYDTIKIFEPDLPNIYGYSLFNHLFLVNRNNGIYLFRNGEIVFLPHTDQLVKENGIYELLEYDSDNFIILTERKGIVLYNFNNILKTLDKNNHIKYNFEFNELVKQLPTKVHNYVERFTLTVSSKVNDNLFAFGSLKGGVILMNEKGDIVGALNKNRGLNDNSASEIFTDKNGDLWIGMNYGVAHVKTSFPFTNYQDNYALNDAVLSTIKTDDTRYFGTMNGIFSIPEQKIEDLINVPKLNRVNEIEFSAWDLINFNGNLFTTGEQGIYQILDNKGKELINSKKAYLFEPANKFSNHLFLGLVDGILLVKITTNPNGFAKAEIINEFKEFNKSVRGIINDKFGNVWITSQYNSIYYIKFGDTPNDYQIFNFDTIHGLPNPDFNYVHITNDKILVTTEKGVYKYTGPGIISEINDSVDYFEPDSIFEMFYNHDSLVPVRIHEINDSSYWIQTDYTIGKFINKKSGAYWNDSVSKILQPAYYTYLEDDGIIWVCDDRGITKYNTTIEKDLSSPYYTLVRKIIISQDSTIFNGFNCIVNNRKIVCPLSLNQLGDIPTEFDYINNSFEFHYSAAYYEEIDKTEYRFRLEGYDKNWSPWTKETKKEYTNLNEGDYTFMVKARNVFGHESEITTYSFHISPPWYRTILAYIGYLILLALLFYLGIRLNSKRLKAANLRLEEIVRKRTEEIRKQKDELEKLSIVASETDNAVIIMDEAGNIEWVNDGFTRMYGYTQDELLNIKGKNIVNASANVYIKDVLNSVIHKKESIIYESMFVSKEGHNIWVQTTLTPILNSSGKVVKLVAIDTDIGKLKTAEEEISQQKEELQTQSELLEETNIELERTNLLITDSIKYAKLIQDAILPNSSEITDAFPESFIFYQPKSIVSGDFYWIAHTEEKTYLAVVDCTGHGVPGAFMSLIGSIMLNEIINNKRLTNPAIILDRLNKGVINALGQTGKREEIQDDGMDMTLLVIDKKAKKMNLALANHTVFFFKGNELNTIEGDIFSIGGVLSKSIEVKFTNHEYKIENGDVIYLFSDGFQDQFGGESGKKYMATRFKNFITQIHSHGMQIQEHKIKNEFKSWQGYEKQVDDVLVIGLKFSNL